MNLLSNKSAVYLLGISLYNIHKAHYAHAFVFAPMSTHPLYPICSVLFTNFNPQNSKKYTAEHQMLDRAFQTKANLHQDSEGDLYLAVLLNGMIEIPFSFRNEAQQKKRALEIARKMNVVFETFVPESKRAMLRNTTPEELQKNRSSLIVKMNEHVDIPFKTKSEEEERVQFAALVDFLLQRYGLMPIEEPVDVTRELDIVAVALEPEVRETIYEKTIEGATAKRKILLEKKARLEKLAFVTTSI